MKDIIDGTKRLLVESLNIIDDRLEDVIIVGGWGPYIRHINEHPGTMDVDILFPANYSKTTMAEILEKFLSGGFFISAKNDFQLCKIYRIGVQSYVYNIDLLHPVEGKINKTDFVEIMDLDVTVGKIKVKSLVSTHIEFGNEIYSNNLYQSINFGGKTFNVLDGAGVIISKLNSSQNKKRPRDILDIYLSLTEPRIAEKINHLYNINDLLKSEINKFKKRIKSDWDFYQDSLKRFGVTDSNAKKIILINGK